MEDLRGHLETILRWKRLVLAITILGAVAGVLLALTGGGTQYEAESTVIVGASSVQIGRSPEQDATLARGYVDRINGSLQGPIRERGEVPGSVGINAESVSGSPFIVITASAGDEQVALDGAKNFTNAFVVQVTEANEDLVESQIQPVRERLNQLTRQIGIDERRLDDAAAGRVSLSADEQNQIESRLARQRPEAEGLTQRIRDLSLTLGSPSLVGVLGFSDETTQINDRLVANGVLGLIGGLLLGSVLALFLNALELRLSTPGQVRRRLGLETLAIVPSSDPGRRVEAYQALANKLALTQQSRRSVAVTSPGREDGKSAVARNVARYRAELGDQVVLIDATFEGRSNGSSPAGDGLAELLSDQTDDVKLGEVLVDSNIANLRLLPAGAMPKDPYALFSGDRMSKVLEQASLFADLVVIDAPPVLDSAESQVICSLADGALLVVDAGSTRTARASEARDELDRVKAEVLGVVLRDAARGGMSLRS
ncbi:MAG: CpsD/CapB family tyrosine-protein kinase [Thermoleophilia bacterium]|nr:CpsD/CapB family tyrosine-protein kinase [Thermoleophilia bacterium]